MAIKILNGIDVVGSMNITASDIPSLDASKITSGTLASARIPVMDASKIGSGTFGASRIPNLDASKITTGTIPAARIADLSSVYAAASAIPTKVSDLTNDIGYLSSIPTHNQSADTITGGTLGANGRIALSNHPEAGALLTPSFENDLAYITYRGGSVVNYLTDSTDYTQPTLNNLGNAGFSSETPFNGTTNYAYATLPSTSSVVVWDIEMPFSLSYGNTWYVDFGAGAWQARDVTFLAYQTNGNAEPTYKVVGSTFTNVSSGLKFTSGSYSYQTTSGSTGWSYNRLRVVMTNWDRTNPRIAAIGAKYYNSQSLAATLLSRGGGTVYGNIDAQGSITASNLNVSNWDTAYGWGNHASEGYLTTVAWNDVTNKPTLDNYGSWNLKTNSVQRTTVGSGGDLNLVAGTNVSLAYSAGGTVTISSTDTNTTYSVGDNGLTEKNFTSALKTKLDGIEAGANVTDASNVSAAGALMRSGGTMTGALTISTASDGHLILKQTDAGSTAGTKEGGWNYMQFYDGQNDRQGYFGIDSSGNFLFNPEVSGAEVRMNRTLRVSASIISTGSISVSGTISASGYNSSNWDTAYGWGNHGSAGYAVAGSNLADLGDVAEARTNLGLGSAALEAKSAFASASHTHVIGDVTGLQTALDGKAAASHSHSYLPLAGGTLTGDLTTSGNIKGANLQISSTTPTIYFNGTSDGGDYASSDMAIKATPEGLDFYEPEDGNKIHFQILDDAGVNAPYGYKWNGQSLDARYAAASHTHAYSSLTGIPTSFTPSVHTHSITDIDGLQTELDGKQPTGNYITSLAGYATETYVNTAVSNLVDSAPTALNTLNELAAALGDDANFATTVSNSIGTKVSKAGDTMTGDITWTSTGRGLQWTMNTDGAYIRFYNTGDADTNSRLEYATTDNGNEYHRFMVAGIERMTITASGITATGYNKSNWDTAYSWGNHASAGYLTSVPAEFLTDGEGDARYLGINAKAADSNLLDGLDLGGTRANVANKVVRTDGNGYLNTGWINTTSGNTTGTLTDIYVNTGDGYIRKATPAHFRSQITDGVYQPAGTYNTVIGTDSDINTSGSTIIDNIYVTDGVITSMGTRTLTAADLGIAKPQPPVFGAANIVGETIEIVFDKSPTSGVDSYQVWSSVAGGSYGLIANIPTQDIAVTMTAVDAVFSVSGTQAYRVYAIKNGIYSDPAEGSVSYATPTLDVVNMSVVNLNTAYYIQYDLPDSRFIDHIEIYMDAEISDTNLSRTGATLVYSGNNTSYMYQIAAADLDKYHQFWVEVVES